MNLNIRKLMRAGEEAVAGTARFDFSSADFGHFTATAPVEFTYHAQPENGLVRLDITIRAEIAAECARCLLPVATTVAAQKQYVVQEADLTDEFPELPITAAGLDLQELAYGELVLEAPPVLLCSEDCPGLCPTCGQRECGCEHSPEGDPRWDVLRALLNDGGES